MVLPTTSVSGLVSGIDSASIIEQMMALERQPVNDIELKVQIAEAEQEAYRSVNRMLLDYKTQVDILGKTSTWNAKSATSSDENLLSVEALDSAQTGAYTFRAVRTAQTHQMMSSGFTDIDNLVGTGEVRIDQAGASLARSTKIQSLNGDAGIQRGSIRITDRSGKSTEIDLATAETVTDVLNAINNNNDIDMTASLDGQRLVLTDTSGGAGNLVVDEVNGRTTAQDLGIYTGPAGLAGGSLTGNSIYVVAGTSALASLRDGLGIDDGSLGTIRLTDTVTATDYDIDLSEADTVQDVLDAITQAGGGGVFTASLRGDGLGIQISSDLGNTFTVGNDASDPDDTTATDLGIENAVAAVSVTGGDLIGGLDTVMLSTLSGANQAGVDLTGLDITDRAGTATTVNLAGARTLQDVIDTINASAAVGGNAQVIASLNKAGNGIQLTDLSGGVGNLSVQNSGAGSSATDLGVETAGVAASTLKGQDLDKQYISRGTRLEELNSGQGVFSGSIRLVDADGAAATGDLSGLETIGEVITAINGAGLQIQAQINATGDGIELINTKGSGEIRVEEVGGGTTAEDLGILGSATGGATLDGSFEQVFTIGSNDSLKDLAYKIGLSGGGVSASVINDGSGVKPWHLALTSDTSGADGMLVIDTDITGLDFTETSEAQDALLLYGGSMLMSDSDNTFSSAIPGLNITVNQADLNKDVSVNVDHDSAAAAEAATAMTDTFNSLKELVNVLTRWDEEEETGGLLFGDSRINSMMNDLVDGMIQSVSGQPSGFTSWRDLGIEYAYDSEKQASYLEFDESTFLAKLDEDFDAVKTLMAGNRDMARSDQDTSVSADNPATGNVSNLINGNTLSGDFGSTNGYEATYALDDAVNNADGKDIINIQFSGYRPIYQLALHHIDSPSMPAEDYALRDFTVEYFDKVKDSWETARTYTNNKSSLNYISLPDGVLTDKVRITVEGTNAPDKISRLVEVEAFEQTGVAANLRTDLSGLTDKIDGLFTTVDDNYDEKIADYADTIENMEERLEMRQLQLLREFNAMESALAGITQQGDFMSQQMSAWNNSGK